MIRIVAIFVASAAVYVVATAALFARADWPPADRLLGPVIAVGLFVLTVAGLCTAWSFRQFAAPWSRLVRQLAGGTFQPRPDTLTSDADVVANAVEDMQANLTRRLRQSESQSEHLKTVLQTMMEGVIAVDRDYIVLIANQAASQLLDFAVADPGGRALVEVTRARPVHEAAAEALATGSAVTREFDLAGGRQCKLALRASPLPGSPCPGAVLVLRDITELARLETYRRDLVANVSHELKTPLAAIKAYAETLRLGAIHDAQHNLQFVERIEEQAERLHQLISDILRVARHDAGQETLELGEVNVARLLSGCAAHFRNLAAAKAIRLVTACDDAGLAAWADASAVATIVNNLVDNAIKFTPPGGAIELCGSIHGDTVAIAVTDTGIGIPAAEVPRIFERFYRVEKARSRDLGGTGLGLSIVKHLAHAMSGRIEVESMPGSGSTFRLLLPRASTRPSTF